MKTKKSKTYHLRNDKLYSFENKRLVEQAKVLFDIEYGHYSDLLKKSKILLDIGCGNGVSSGRLVPYFKIVEGVDMGVNLISNARSAHPDIKFIMYIEDPVKVEKCVKDFAKIKKAKGNKELYKTSVDTMRKLIFNCADFDMTMKDIVNINDNYKKYDPYIIFDDEEHIEYINIKGDTIGYEKIDKED